MATATFPMFPMFDSGADHNNLQEQYKRSRLDSAEIEPIDEENRVYSVEQVSDETPFNGIIGSSPALKFVLAEVKRVAPTDSTVLVLGETGTGEGLKN